MSRSDRHGCAFFPALTMATAIGVFIGCGMWLAGWPLFGEQQHGARRAVTIGVRAVVLAAAGTTLTVAPQFSPMYWCGFAVVALCGGVGLLSWLRRAVRTPAPVTPSATTP
ncbi:hypothetical protein ACWEEK_33385 [Micromonospora aurantiaca (nom. illeg.)]